MKKSAFISDIIFYSTLIGVFTLVFFRYLRLSLFLATVLSCLCALLTGCGVGALLLHKRKGVYLKRSDEAKKQKLLQHLCLLGDEKKTEFLRNAFSQITGSSLQKSGKLRFADENDLYFLKFHFSPVSEDEVASAARWKSGKQKILLCNEIEENAARLCERLHIRLQTGESVYQALKKAELLPKDYLGEAPPTLKQKRKIWFSKRNAKGFFTGGILLLLTSLFTPFAYYYLLFGSVLLLASLLVRIFGYG